MQVVGPVDTHEEAQLVQAELPGPVQAPQQALHRTQLLVPFKYQPLTHNVQVTMSEQVRQCGIQTAFLRVNNVVNSA